jgi:hypothetical protein
MTRLIGLTGPAGCGKSTIAQTLSFSAWVVRHRFAGPLKAMLRTLGLTEAQVDGNEKELSCALLGGRTPRYAMQTLGTEWGRGLLDDDLWLRATLLQIDATLAETRSPIVVIDDVRFDNEAAAIRTRGGIVIKLVRDAAERRFPVIVPRDKRGREIAGCPTSVLWSLVEPHRAQAMSNHGQTLERLTERGGLAPDEMHAVVHDQRWRPMDESTAIQWLVDAAPKLHASEAGVSPHLIDIIVPNQDAPETVARFILAQLKAP